MKKPRSVSLNTKGGQTIDDNNKRNCSRDGSNNKRRSFFELSLSLIFSLWCLVFLFYFRLGLGHGNGGKFPLTCVPFYLGSAPFLTQFVFFFFFWVHGFELLANFFSSVGFVCFYFAFFSVCFRGNQTKELKVEAFISGVYLLW